MSLYEDMREIELLWNEWTWKSKSCKISENINDKNEYNVKCVCSDAKHRLSVSDD